MQPVRQAPLSQSWCTGHSPSARQATPAPSPPQPASIATVTTIEEGRIVA
jgi:hypothetical protein